MFKKQKKPDPVTEALVPLLEDATEIWTVENTWASGRYLVHDRTGIKVYLYDGRADHNGFPNCEDARKELFQSCQIAIANGIKRKMK
jgi:hypothetical protein